MFQSLVTIAAQTSVLSPSVNYYGHISPKSDSRYFNAQNNECRADNLSKTFKITHLGEQVYKLDQSIALKYFDAKTDQFVTVMSEAYLNTKDDSQERPVLPIVSDSAFVGYGIPVENTLSQRFHCREEKLAKDAKLYTYNLNLGEEINDVSISPELYSHQIDLSTDLCTNLLDFAEYSSAKKGDQPVLVLNQFIMDQFCYEIDLEKGTLRVGNWSAKRTEEEIAEQKRIEFEKTDKKSIRAANFTSVIADAILNRMNQDEERAQSTVVEETQPLQKSEEKLEEKTPTMPEAPESEAKIEEKLIEEPKAAESSRLLKNTKN